MTTPTMTVSSSVILVKSSVQYCFQEALLLCAAYILYYQGHPSLSKPCIAIPAIIVHTA